MIPTPAAVARYVNKANVVTLAWRGLFNAAPTRKAVVLSMAVAEFETHLGDAGGTWKGEHNWGAVHKRSLTKAEADVLAARKILPTGGEAAVTAARAVIAPTAPDEALHIDDSPTGKYFVWFFAFPSDVEAARKFLQTLVVNRPGVRAVLDQGTAADVARAMYTSHYFTGVHRNDPEANIADYAKNVAAKADAIDQALSLAGWDPAHATAPREDPSTARVLADVVEERAERTAAVVEAGASSHGFGLVVGIGAALGGAVLLLAMSARARSSRVWEPAGAEVTP